MIKKFLCLACTLSLASALNAAITVIQDGQQPANYKDGSVISVNGKAKTVVNYGKNAITVPQGQAVRISSDANGNVLVAGTNLNRIQIGGSVISADGNTTLRIDPETQYVTVLNGGPAYFTTAGRTSTVAKGSSIKIAVIPEREVNNLYDDNIDRYNRPAKKAEQKKQAPATVIPAVEPMVAAQEDPMQAFLSEAERVLDLPDFATRQTIDDVVLEEVSESTPGTI